MGIMPPVHILVYDETNHLSNRHICRNEYGYFVKGPLRCPDDFDGYYPSREAARAATIAKLGDPLDELRSEDAI